MVVRAFWRSMIAKKCLSLVFKDNQSKNYFWKRISRGGIICLSAFLGFHGIRILWKITNLVTRLVECLRIYLPIYLYSIQIVILYIYLPLSIFPTTCRPMKHEEGSHLTTTNTLNQVRRRLTHHPFKQVR